MSISLQVLVDNVGELASFPDICLRVNEMANNPDSSTADVGCELAQR